jgi:hypothetical protein
MRKAILLSSLCWALQVLAQDAVQVDPKHFKVEYEDDKIRVVREILPAGESTPKHSHPERVTVAVRAATLQIVDEAGNTRREEVKQGEATHLDAQTHKVTNIGKTDFEEVSTEFKVPLGKQPPSAEVSRSTRASLDQPQEPASAQPKATAPSTAVTPATEFAPADPIAGFEARSVRRYATRRARPTGVADQRRQDGEGEWD